MLRDEIPFTKRNAITWSTVIVSLVLSSVGIYLTVRVLGLSISVLALSIMLAVHACGRWKRGASSWVEFEQDTLRMMSSTGRITEVNLRRVTHIRYADYFSYGGNIGPIRDLSFFDRGHFLLASWDLNVWADKQDVVWTKALLDAVTEMGIDMPESDRQALLRLGRRG